MVLAGELEIAHHMKVKSGEAKFEERESDDEESLVIT